MSDGLMLIIGEDGTAREYDDTYDITIHCESAEEQDQVRRMLTRQWVPVTERRPNHELAIVQYSDGGFGLLQFPTAYRWKDIVAWMPIPEPFEEGTKQ